MQSLKTSCLRWLIVYFVLAALCIALIYERFPRINVALGAGFGAAFLIWCGIGYIVALRTRRAEVRMIRSAARGDHPEDGAKIAVTGAAGGGVDVLESPITKRRCVLYEYKILPAENESAAAFEGFAVSGMTIDGPRGSIRLLAAPELAFDEEKYGGPAHVKNAREYVEQTEWTVHEGLDIKREVAHLKNVLADDDGKIRYDIRRMAMSKDDVSTMAISEKIVAPGERICAIGRFSAPRGGLVPDPTVVMHSVKLLKGDPDEIVRKLKRRNSLDAVMGCGCLLPVIIAALIAVVVVPLEAIEQMISAKDPSWTEVRVEQWVRLNLRPLVKPSGDVRIQLEPGQARGKLTAGDTTTPLTSTHVKRDGEVVELWILGGGAPASGVVARIQSPNTLESLRIVGDGTIPAYDVETEQLRVTDEEAVGRLTYLGDDAKLRVTFRARLP